MSDEGKQVVESKTADPWSLNPWQQVPDVHAALLDLKRRVEGLETGQLDGQRIGINNVQELLDVLSRAYKAALPENTESDPQAQIQDMSAAIQDQKITIRDLRQQLDEAPHHDAEHIARDVVSVARRLFDKWGSQLGKTYEEFIAP